MDFDAFCNEVFGLDKKIRYVGIFYKDFKHVKMRQGITNLLSPEETERSLGDAVSRWKTREVLSHKIGQPLYAMASYEKIKRITIPIPNKGLILISMEPDAYHEILTKEIIEIRDRCFE